MEKAEGATGIMGQGGVCLRFQPVLRKGLGNTIAQMLAGMGLLPGGQGGGQGRGNVGLYGTTPDGDVALGGSRGMRGGAARGQGRQGEAVTMPGAEGGSLPDAVAPGSAAVPPSYRKRVAEYFRRIADENAGR